MNSRASASLTGQNQGQPSSGNWLADLSVEVCKVDMEEEEEDDEEEEEEEDEGSSQGSQETAEEEADWDESVFFEAAATGQQQQSTNADQYQAGHLDVLLGNPNLQHNSSESIQAIASFCLLFLAPTQLAVRPSGIVSRAYTTATAPGHPVYVGSMFGL